MTPSIPAKRRSPGDRLTVPPSWGLDEPPGSPLELFASWMDRAKRAGVAHATAVTVSTASREGAVSARTVILKEWTPTCLVFESETYSRKGTELAVNPSAAMTLYWREVHRQICVAGEASPLPIATSDAMWARRARPNQAASVVSREGEVLDSSEDELALQDAADRLVESSSPIIRPSTYVAYGLSPSTIEFWEGSEDRLHRRVIYELGTSGWRWRRIKP